MKAAHGARAGADGAVQQRPARGQHHRRRSPAVAHRLRVLRQQRRVLRARQHLERVDAAARRPRACSSPPTSATRRPRSRSRARGCGALMSKYGWTLWASIQDGASDHRLRLLVVGHGEVRPGGRRVRRPATSAGCWRRCVAPTESVALRTHVTDVRRPSVSRVTTPDRRASTLRPIVSAAPPCAIPLTGVPEGGGQRWRQSQAERRRADARRTRLQAGAEPHAGRGFSNFAISFSIISILAGCFTTFGFGWNNGGPIAISLGLADHLGLHPDHRLLHVGAGVGLPDLGRHLLVGLASWAAPRPATTPAG